LISDKSFFSKKRIVLGVTASIAAFKAASICSRLKGLGADVFPVMTPGALNFISPTTFSSISGNETIVEQFANKKEISHISLSHSSDAFLIAPTSANTISKLSYGVGDNFLTTSVIAAKCPVLIAPAMNDSMYQDDLIKENIERLKGSGKFFFVGPATGKLACGEEGMGRLENEEVIIERLAWLMDYSKDLKGKRVIVTAGGTREFIDRVRYISNKSSGKMGYALAEEAYFRGAREVILISTVKNLPTPYGVKLYYVESTDDMKKAILGHFKSGDITIMAAAVSDIIPAKKYDFKLRKKDGILSKISFRENENILKILAEKKKKNQYLVGFAAEEGSSFKDAWVKFEESKIDMIVANDISREDIGMESDYNEVSVLKRDGNLRKLKKDRKRLIAREIYDEISKDLIS